MSNHWARWPRKGETIIREDQHGIIYAVSHADDEIKVRWFGFRVVSVLNTVDFQGKRFTAHHYVIDDIRQPSILSVMAPECVIAGDRYDTFSFDDLEGSYNSGDAAWVL